MPDELDRYFNALRRDSDSTLLTDSNEIRRTGTRRARNRHLASAGLACLAVAAVVVGVATLSPGGRTVAQIPAAGGKTPSVATTPPTPSPLKTPGPTGPTSTPSKSAGAGTPQGNNPPCTVADFGQNGAMSDSAAGTAIWVVTFTNVGSRTCALGGLPTVWLVDPDTGRQVRLHDANPYQAPHAPRKVLVQPGQQVTTALSMGTVALESSDPASCAHTVTYQTMKVQLSNGVFTAHNLGMSFSCKGLHGAGPNAGDWTL